MFCTSYFVIESFSSFLSPLLVYFPRIRVPSNWFSSFTGCSFAYSFSTASLSALWIAHRELLVALVLAVAFPPLPSVPLGSQFLSLCLHDAPSRSSCASLLLHSLRSLVTTVYQHDSLPLGILWMSSKLNTRTNSTSEITEKPVISAHSLPLLDGKLLHLLT
jgi:hypothetical protein